MWKDKKTKATFGRTVRIMRNDRGLTQTQLANAIGGTRGDISIIERGLCYPMPDTLRRLAEAFGCSVEDLESGRLI